MADSERFLLYDVGLWIDLRWDTEIDHERLSPLIDDSPGGQIERIQREECFVDDFLLLQSSSSLNRRFYTNIGADMHSKESIMNYIQEKLISMEALQQIAKTTDKKEKKMIMIQALTKDGVLGMNQGILLNKAFIFNVLKTVTLYLEQYQYGTVLLHCTLGKDRTGMISMLLQHLAGINDDEIIQDYSKSNIVKERATEVFQRDYKGMVDASIFAGAEPETMKETVAWIRNSLWIYRCLS